jgi:hypothetical protein
MLKEEFGSSRDELRLRRAEAAALNLDPFDKLQPPISTY